MLDVFIHFDDAELAQARVDLEFGGQFAAQHAEVMGARDTAQGRIRIVAGAIAIKRKIVDPAQRGQAHAMILVFARDSRQLVQQRLMLRFLHGNSTDRGILVLPLRFEQQFGELVGQ